MAPDDDLESQLSEFRRRYREQEDETSPDAETEEPSAPSEDEESSPEEPSEQAPTEEPPSSPAPDETPGKDDEDPREVPAAVREVGLPGWLWLVLGCSGLIVMTGFALGFGLWGGYRLLRTQVLVSSPDGVNLAREIIRFDMPEGARSRSTVNLIYRMAIVDNGPDQPTALLAVGSFPAGWSGNPEEVFVDRFDRHVGRGRLTFRSGNEEEHTRQLCDRTVTYERRAGVLTREDSKRAAVLYHSCFRRPGETLCVRCLGLGEKAEQRGRELFDSLRCP